jgi:hypothetical protein
MRPGLLIHMQSSKALFPHTPSANQVPNILPWNLFRWPEETPPMFLDHSWISDPKHDYTHDPHLTPNTPVLGLHSDYCIQPFRTPWLSSGHSVRTVLPVNESRSGESSVFKYTRDRSFPELPLCLPFDNLSYNPIAPLSSGYSDRTGPPCQ